jgi:hypothetical protein
MLFYTIGYDLDALGGGANQCKSYTGALESPTITAYSALQQMASNIEIFYNQPNPGDLTRIYTEIVAEIGDAHHPGHALAALRRSVRRAPARALQGTSGRK